jgi:hypothetical protein
MLLNNRIALRRRRAARVELVYVDPLSFDI